jgi:hypothetical protein
VTSARENSARLLSNVNMRLSLKGTLALEYRIDKMLSGAGESHQNSHECSGHGDHHTVEKTVVSNCMQLGHSKKADSC